MLICVCLRILTSSRIPRYDLGRQTSHFWGGSVTGVWLRRMKNEIYQWKVCTIKQSHTCGTSEVWHVHPQCTIRFLGHQIISIVWAQSNIIVAALVIYDLTTYQVRYSKAWRAEEYALTLLWGRLKRIVHKSIEIIKCHITLQPKH
jgi:hypothetical protein